MRIGAASGLMRVCCVTCMTSSVPSDWVSGVTSYIVLVSSISLAIAVLKEKRSISSVTPLIVWCSFLMSLELSPFWTSALPAVRRKTRFKNR